MPDVSTFRLYLLRGTYLLMVVGLGFTIWPGVVHHSHSVKLMNGVVMCDWGLHPVRNPVAVCVRELREDAR